jgi:hypothetical protein
LTGIFLGTIKLSPGEIKDVILKLDEKLLDHDNAIRILEACPTSEEVTCFCPWVDPIQVTAIRAYTEKGDVALLGNVEKYFLEATTMFDWANRFSGEHNTDGSTQIKVYRVQACFPPENCRIKTCSLHNLAPTSLFVRTFGK